jgi:DNA-binding transcriptional LysR family regulator
MVLTELGTRLLPKIQTILNGVDELAAEVAENATDPRGDVRVGALPSLYLQLIVPLFSALRSLHPNIRLQVFEGSAGQIDQWLVNGFIDIGLPYRYSNQGSLGAEPLLNVESFLVGKLGSPLLRKAEIRFSQLDGVPLVLPAAPSNVRLLLDQIAREHRVKLNVVLEADSTQIQHAVASTGEAFTILPKHAVAAELSSGRLQLAKIIDPVIERSIALGITSIRPMSTATKIVARMIRNHFNLQDLTGNFQSDSPK